MAWDEMDLHVIEISTWWDDSFVRGEWLLFLALWFLIPHLSFGFLFSCVCSLLFSAETQNDCRNRSSCSSSSSRNPSRYLLQLGLAFGLAGLGLAWLLMMVLLLLHS